VSLYQRIMARGEYPYRRRAVPDLKPDLLAESKERDDDACRNGIATVLARIEAVEAGIVPEDAFAGVPDPYGPDPVVFGTVPRVGPVR
jgi:hypothetical protein